MKDLFEHYQELPPEIQNILGKYPVQGFSYQNCKNLEEELKPHGYIFDWGLSAEPFNLRKSTTSRIKKPWYIQAHNHDNEFIIFDCDTADEAIRKAAKEDPFLKPGFACSFQRIDHIPDPNWSVNFKGEAGAGRLTINLHGLTIKEAIEKAEEHDFIAGSNVTHFERPPSWKK